MVCPFVVDLPCVVTILLNLRGSTFKWCCLLFSTVKLVTLETTPNKFCEAVVSMLRRSVAWRHKEWLCSRLCRCMLICVYCGIFLSSNQNTVDRFPSYKRYESIVETEAQDEDVKREKEKLMHITSSSSECSSFSVFVKVRAALYVNNFTWLSSLKSRSPRTCYSLLCFCCCCCCFFFQFCLFLFICLFVI